jgi:hypothetical protein
MSVAAQTSSSSQQAMETLTAQWYNAVVTGCGLDRSEFQLFQGNVAIPPTSEFLWNIFDVVPPASVSNYYNPSQANVFSSDYGAVINNLEPQNAHAFVVALGDYYSQWDVYLATRPPMPQGGIFQLFKDWAKVSIPEPGQVQQCVTAYRQVSQGVVPAAVEMWADAGGFGTQKAYNTTIEQLKLALQGVAGKSVSMNSDTQSRTVSDTWAEGEVGGWYDMFAGKAGGEWDNFTTSLTKAGVEISANFTHFVTFSAGPLAKASQDPILKAYQPWYWEPALNLAYQHNDNTVWKHSAPTWTDTFGEHGNMLRTTSALVVVDGVNISITSAASFDSTQQTLIKANASAGFWPFFEASVSGGWENEVDFDDHGRITATSQAPTGNPQVLGAIVTPIANTL